MGIAKLVLSSLLVTAIFVSSFLAPDLPEKTAAEKIQLGRYLFFDNRLSYNQQKSCASCHDPKFCFTDGYRTSSGADGFLVQHNAPSLINSVYLKHYTWADSSIHQLAHQMRNPLFNSRPNELGVKGNETIILKRLAADSFYSKAFQKAYPTEKEPVNIQNIILSITAFESTLTSFNSRYDQYRKGNSKALNAAELAGMRLFFSDSLNCAKCHDNPSRSIPQDLVYANTGLYNLHQTSDYPVGDQGLFEYSKQLSDRGKFRIPSLKNVLLTAPYTHDGTLATIQEMIAIYAAGGRNIPEGDFKGDGRTNQNKSTYLKGFQLTKTEQANLIAFLNSMTDTVNLHNPNWTDPFKQR